MPHDVLRDANRTLRDLKQVQDRVAYRVEHQAGIGEAKFALQAGEPGAEGAATRPLEVAVEQPAVHIGVGNQGIYQGDDG